MGRNGKMGDMVINSTYLNEAIEVRWYLPEGFTPFKDYTICYVQDGNDYFQIGRMATISDRLHEEMLIEPTIFVGIHYQNKTDRRKKYHPDGELHEAYVTFLMREVIPQVENHLHVEPVARALMGDSLAGTFAFIVASMYPSTFQKVIMQSPFVNDIVLEQAKTMDHTSVVIYHSIGLEETIVHTTDGQKSDFLTPNRVLNQILNEKNFTYHYEEFNGDHTWTYWQKDLAKIIEWMFREV